MVIAMVLCKFAESHLLLSKSLLRPLPLSSILTVGHKFRSTPTNGHRFTALSVLWWSPIQVLTEVDVT